MNVIAHNLSAMNTQRQFNIVNTKRAKTTEKLSSGYRINRAADDAAGLAISEKMRRLVRGLNQAAENIQEGIGYVQTADGALDEAQAMLQRINELAVKSANDTNTQDDRGYIDSEVQHLKEELERIFKTTTFNERKIWEPNCNLKQVGVKLKQAVTSTTRHQSLKVTNDNYAVLADGSYKINADDQGINVSWKGYNGQTYQTKTVDWATLEANNYSFEMSDYFDDQINADLFDAGGNPVFTRKISFRIEPETTVDDMITCLNGRSMSGSASAYMSGQFENPDGSSARKDISVYSASLTYAAAYASRTNGVAGRDFDAPDDVFFEPTGGGANLISQPSATTVDDARNSTEGWTFSFELDGVGTVRASSKSVNYASSDRAMDDENVWWEYYDVYVNGKVEKRQATIERTFNDGTLGNVMEALTGDKTSDTPGLLTAAEGGAADSGGYIDINFKLTADNAFTCGSSTSTSVGSFTLRINVSASDTEQTILDKINNTLNSNTVFDFYTNSADRDSAGMGGFNAQTHMVEEPIYGGSCEFYVQAGPEADQRVDIVYDALCLRELGMTGTNVLTREDANEAMEEVKDALTIINKQRADFGAYQNRLEHAYRSNKNIEENTQAAESLIRDTDMAKTMVEYSNQNILAQAGQAMLVQANNNRDGLLQLLQ